jgi:hypothetical protein
MEKKSRKGTKKKEAGRIYKNHHCRVTDMRNRIERKYCGKSDEWQ